jgi:hypothetical integral membrane protein (TIGR02206 family)
MDQFLSEDNVFLAYSSQHYLPLATTFIIGCIIILFAKKYLNVNQQKNLLLWISVIPFIGTFMLYPMAMIEGDFNIKEDLPLHLCRILALAVPFVIWKENRYWIGVFYFWIMVGTLNANITPEVEFGFPHWSYFSYWMTHSFLVIIPLYYILVFGIRIEFRDFRNAFIMMNVFVLITLFFNSLLGSNYMYTMDKPPVDSLLDILGPWPGYLISGQLLAAALFYIAYLPFKFIKRN